MTAQEQQDPEPEQTQDEQQGPASFDEWLQSADETVKGLYETHITGLKNTIKATRDERDGLTKQLRDLSAQAEKGSEFESKLNKLAGEYEEANARAAFYENAPAQECRNPKAAYAIMRASELITRTGEPDWEAIKQAAPELFGKAAAQYNAGSGTNQQPKKASMNDWIRSARK